MTFLILALLTVPKNDKDHQLAISHPHKNNCLISTVIMRGSGVLTKGDNGGGIVCEDYM